MTQRPRRPFRSGRQQVVDFVTFPVRAVALFGGSRWGMSSLASERFDYVAREITGRCLDVGCGPGNRFVREYLGAAGIGIDVQLHDGMEPAHVLYDAASFPFDDRSFDHVTFIACINHIPESQRDAELAEAFRVLRPGGSIVVTMGHPLAEILVHRLVALYDRVLGTHYDADGQRGMDEHESLYLHDREIRERLARAGYTEPTKRYFTTQWGLNHLIVATKPAESPVVAVDPETDPSSRG